MSDILERIKAEDRLWRAEDDRDVWEDELVGKFVKWYNRNVMQLEYRPMYTSHLISLARQWKDPEKLDILWARAMLEGGDGDT